MGALRSFSLILGLLAIWLISQSVFIVNEWELAIKFKLGEFEQAGYDPGIHGKIPFINTVRKFDARILTLDAPPSAYLTLEKKNVIVDSFVKWRIEDEARFYTSLRGSESQAVERLSKVVQDGLRGEFAKRTVQEAISGERSQIMDVLTRNIAEEAKDFGIQIVDVRIQRIELPAEVSRSVFERMETERERVAQELRSRGQEAGERIRADADRQRTIILAEANRESERVRGSGDGKAAEIYAKAFSRNAEFYSLYRSLGAYRNVFNKQEDVLVLDPKSEFFNYFGKASGKR